MELSHWIPVCAGNKANVLDLIWEKRLLACFSLGNFFLNHFLKKVWKYQWKKMNTRFSLKKFFLWKKFVKKGMICIHSILAHDDLPALPMSLSRTLILTSSSFHPRSLLMAGWSKGKKSKALEIHPDLHSQLHQPRCNEEWCGFGQ